jgi:hypothetical protein
MSNDIQDHQRLAIRECQKTSATIRSEQARECGGRSDKFVLGLLRRGPPLPKAIPSELPIVRHPFSAAHVATLKEGQGF